MDRHILIVDDENDIRDMLSRHFKFAGFKVSTAENGVAALDILSQDAPRVVISDITMPVMDGIDLLREIRTQYPMTRVIMMTGYVSLDNALSCMRNHADTCIFKPLSDLSELDSAVTDAFERLDHWEKKFMALQDMKPAGPNN